jgi:hypothetical protein
VVEQTLPVADRILLFAAVFLIDFGSHEDTEGQG